MLTLKYVPISAAKLWDRNAKLHDLPALADSIALHGFRDPPAYDAALDAFVEGNGRTEALQQMHAHGRERPRAGVGWMRRPASGAFRCCLVSMRARLAAERYGIDHNNLVLAGGDFTAVDMAGTGGEDYLQIVKKTSKRPGSFPSACTVRMCRRWLMLRSTERRRRASRGAAAAHCSHSRTWSLRARHVVESGDIWHIGGHVLICADVMTGWRLGATCRAMKRSLSLPWSLRPTHHSG